MNTTELKKLAEAASLNGAQLLHMSVSEFAEAQQRKQEFQNLNPAAILKLLAINAELVEALKQFVAIYGTDDVRGWMDVRNAARSALAKAEGGEL